MPRPDLATRVWRRVDKQTDDGCWLWTAAIDTTGYGRVWANGRMLGAHRVVYELTVGPIPEGLTLDHLCRNRACVNPAHLEPVTLGENVLRGSGPAARNARKTHCPQGHRYDGHDGQARTCSACRADAMERARLRRRARTAVGYPPGFWDVPKAAS